MRWTLGVLTLLFAMPSLSAGGAAQNDVVTISSLEWPPYAGSSLRQGGATTEVIRTAFHKAGFEIKVVYKDWPTAIEMARKGHEQVIAYYPGYHCRHREGFIASDPVGNSPLGFAEHVDAPLLWRSLDDIGDRNLKIGTVRGYTNTDEFDAKVGMGWIHAISSENDAANLRKLLRKRIDGAVVDKYVLAFLKATDEILRKDPERLRFNDKPLEEKTFYLCFRDDEKGGELMRAFNLGLSELDVDGMVQNYVLSVAPK